MCNDPLFSLQDIFLPEKMTSKLVIFFLVIIWHGQHKWTFSQIRPVWTTSFLLIFVSKKNVLGTIWTIKSKQINIKTIIRKWYEWSRQSYAMKTNLLKINSLLNYLSHPTSIFLHNKSLDQLQFDLYLFRQLYVCHRSVANQRTRHCNQAAVKNNLFYRLKQ